MEEKYFNIRYEFDHATVHDRISQQIDCREPSYICVADGVILNEANRNPWYLDVINSGMFCICDSSYVPLYIRWIHKKNRGQYAGYDIFRDIALSCKWRMAFIGASSEVLDALKKKLCQTNPEVEGMLFMELPFMYVADFDYKAIADAINEDGAEIIWVALGAPKQEIFMHYLRPHISKGVMIAVGAVFKFYSGLEVKRAPRWMVHHHLEFLHRIYKEPNKQLRRCSDIVYHLPRLLWREWRAK